MVEVVAVEPLVDFPQKFSGRLQVNLSGSDIHVAHVRGQSWEPGIDILAVSIPAQQTMDREGVPQVMNAWTSASSPFHTTLCERLHEGLTHGRVAQTLASLVQQQGRVWQARFLFGPPLYVVSGRKLPFFGTLEKFVGLDFLDDRVTRSSAPRQR